MLLMPKNNNKCKISKCFKETYKAPRVKLIISDQNTSKIILCHGFKKTVFKTFSSLYIGK